MVALLAFGRSVAVASEAHGMVRLQKINTWTGLLDIIDDFADGRRVVLGSPSTPCGHGAAAGVGHRCTYFVSETVRSIVRRDTHQPGVREHGQPCFL